MGRKVVQGIKSWEMQSCPWYLCMCSIEKPGNGSTSSQQLQIAQISSAPPTFPSSHFLSKTIYSYGDWLENVSNEPSKSRLIYHMIFQ